MNGLTVDLKVSIGELPALTRLQGIWSALEARADPSFFQSWLWIGTWLESLPARIAPLLLQVERDGAIVGLAIVVKREIVRYGFLRSRALYLNDTGDEVLDEITIEHNGFLAERGCDDRVARACVEYLLNDHDGWDEFFLDGLRRPESAGAPLPGRACVRIASRRQCHFVDLDGLRQSGGDYLSLLGKNTRYSIRRSMRGYEKLGSLHLEEAASVAQALGFLDQLRVHHQRYWVQKGLPGSFANQFFSKFHERLVERGFAQGAIQLLRLTAGSHEIGYLYNFVYRGRVYNYQSGFDYDLGDAHGRPGLVCHALAVEHNARKGNRLYDFMAGDSDYKKNLGTDSETMAWVVIQQSRLKFRVEAMLRHIKHRLQRKTPIPEHATQPDSSSSTQEVAP